MTKFISEYEETFRVELFDINQKGEATILTIADFLQQTGMNHAFRLFESAALSMDKETAFVLTRLKISMERYPKWRENIFIHTWLSPIEGKYIIRNFEIFDGNKNLIGAAINSATPFNLKERRAVSLEERGYHIAVSSKRPPIEHNFEKIFTEENYQWEKTIDVGFYDCDLYGHVNNVKYIGWALDVLPDRFNRSVFLKEVDINFKSEVNYHHRVHVKAGQYSGGNNQFFHEITRDDKGKTVIVMKSQWSG